jgi:Ca-activated chloride channel family protein
MKTKRCLFALVAAALGLSALGDGFIITHHPDHPGIFPPPPRPRPPVPPPAVVTPRQDAMPLEVTFHQVAVKVRDQVAVTRLDQEFYNPTDRTLEGTYLFPIPRGAQLDQFSMDINGRQVAAELLPADKARQLYEDIVRCLRDPALLEYADRDLLKARIFPIEARGKKRIKLSYTQVLKADSGLVHYRYPLNTEKFSAKPIPSVSLSLDLESARPLKSIYSPTHAVEVRRHGDFKATVGFESKDVKPDTDFHLFYALEPGELGASLLTYRPEGEDGFFLLLASPAVEIPGEKILPKDVVFVQDVSGSMAGSKLEQAKKALQFCVASLNDDDRFDIIRFATESDALFGHLAPANRDHRDRATRFIGELRALGGTAIHDALQRALAARSAAGDRPFLIIFLTDGLPTVGTTDTDAIVSAVTQAGQGRTRIFCFGIGHDVNTHLLDRITETTRATSAYVLPEEDLEVKVSTFFSKIKDPVLANPRLEFPEGLRVASQYPSPLPDLFKGEQLLVVGRYRGQGAGRLAVSGELRQQTRRFEFPVEFARTATEHDFIPRLWATRRIGHLLDEIRLRGENKELKDEVVELARKYGLVTPYTAYLILEDERARGVPLARQSLPQFATNAAALQVTEAAYAGLKRDLSGPSAIAAARYGLVNRNAQQPDAALAAGRREAASALTAPVPTSAGARGGLNPARPAVPPASPALAAEILRYGQESRFVNGRTFFRNGGQWLDSEIQRWPQAEPQRIQFGSPEYFALHAREPRARPWLALGSSVLFVLDGRVYEIHD